MRLWRYRIFRDFRRSSRRCLVRRGHGQYCASQPADSEARHPRSLCLRSPGASCRSSGCTGQQPGLRAFFVFCPAYGISKPVFLSKMTALLPIVILTLVYHQLSKREPDFASESIANTGFTPNGFSIAHCGAAGLHGRALDCLH